MEQSDTAWDRSTKIAPQIVDNRQNSNTQNSLGIRAVTHFLINRTLCTDWCH